MRVRKRGTEVFESRYVLGMNAQAASPLFRP
jgi:hypothetical protein